MPLGLFLLYTTAKSGLLMIAGYSIIGLARTSAAKRHAVLTATMLGALLLPILGAVLPPFFPKLLTDIPASTNPELRQWTDNAMGLLLVRADTESVVPLRGTWRAVVEHGSSLIVVVWILGTLLLLTRILADLRAAHRVRTRALFLRELPGGVPLLESSEVNVPVTVGLFRSAVMIPRGYTGKLGALETVIVHELAHARRRDCITLLVARLACALHWFNPLVWLAARRMTLEQERACDDCVLASGADPLRYSELLLETARQSAGRPMRLHALPSIASSRLELRITSILNPCLKRGNINCREMLALVLVSTCVLLPMAAFAVHDGTVPGALQEMFLDPQSERVPGVRPAHSLDLTFDRNTTDGWLIETLLTVAPREPRGSLDLVPDRARWALSRVHEGRLIEPLLEALADPDWRVRGYAAWALALSGDTRAVPALISALDHPVWRLRAMAASALRALDDPRAAGPLAKALHDEAWQVRMEAVAFLGAQRQGSYRSQLEPLRSDSHIAVRLAAHEALSASR